MITFKSKSDLEKLPTINPAYSIIKEYIDGLMIETDKLNNSYSHEIHGYVALVEEIDVNRVIDEIWNDRTLADVPWEAVTRYEGFYVAVYVPNNQYTIGFFIPDADWLSDELRGVLENNLVPTTS